MKIRKARKEDLKTIDEIYVEGTIDEEKLQYLDKTKANIIEDMKKTEKGRRKQILKEIKEKTRLFLVIIENEKVIGFGQAYVEEFDGAKHGGLGRVYIRKEFRGKGIGTKLINILINYLKKKKIKKIESYVYIKNKPSLKIHKKFGFKPEVYKLVKNVR